MTVPTLPVIGIKPSVAFFHTLESLASGLVLAFLGGAIFSSLQLAYAGLLELILCSNQTPRQHQPDGCCKFIKTAFLFVGRRLCVYTFPALFKMHKTRSGRGRQLRKFMVFLDREVHSSLLLIAAFHSIIFSIFCSCSTVFLRYFPVEESAQCLEKDIHDRSLFCYLSNTSIINSSIIDPSLPVDCANYSVTELQELRFQCYAIAIPVGLGIAVAATLGLAKVAIVGVTFYVKVTEWFFTVAKNPPRKLQEVCCRNCGKRQCGIYIYMYISCLFLCTVAVITLVIGIFSITDYAKRDQDPIHIMYYIANMLLPLLIYFPLGYVIVYLSNHCDKGEYASFAADQRPPDPSDWDVESQSSVTSGQHDEYFGSERLGGELDRAEGEYDEENFGQEGGRGNTKCEAEGARLTGTTSGANNRSYGATSLVASLHESGKL